MVPLPGLCLFCFFYAAILYLDSMYPDAAEACVNRLRKLKNLGLHNDQKEYAIYIDAIYDPVVLCCFPNIMLANVHPDKYAFRVRFGREDKHPRMSEFAALQHVTGDFIDPPIFPGSAILATTPQKKQILIQTINEVHLNRVGMQISGFGQVSLTKTIAA